MTVDWARAARLVARGAKPGEIIAEIGCSRSQLRRRRLGCGLFRALVDQYAAEIARSAAAAAAPPATARQLEATVRTRLEEEIAEGNTRVALWLAERLRLFSPAEGEGTQEALERLLETMDDDERDAFSRAE